MRQLNIKQMDLAWDTLDGLPFAWTLDSHIQDVVRNIQSGTYKATRIEYIRGAKGQGLTRPLAFPDTTDRLVYRTVVALAENDLLNWHARSWTGFGREDSQHQQDPDYEPGSGWFRAWLRRQNKLWTLTENYEWLVVSDIANFFPTIQLTDVVAHVLAHSRLDDSLARFLALILRDMSHLPEYRLSAAGGLPQETLDSSRVLAHTYLYPVDAAFEEEGLTNGYSRWMDDIVVGAGTEAEALTTVRRLQLKVEELSLYLNTSKTRIVRRDDYQAGLMKSVNDEVGELAAALRRGEALDVADLEDSIDRHLALEPRREAWPRILRRYYTLARDTVSPRLRPYAAEHLGQFPEAARNILDYLTLFPLDIESFARLATVVDGFQGVYEDLEVLFAVFLSVVPNDDAPLLRRALTSHSLGRLAALQHSCPRVAAGHVLVVCKFGSHADILALERIYLHQPALTVDVEHAMIALLGLEPRSINHGYWEALLGRSRLAGYVSAVRAGEQQATSMALSASRPTMRRPPLRAVFSPRMLLFTPVIRQAAGVLFDNRARAWEKSAKQCGPSLQDHAALRLIGTARAERRYDGERG